MEPFDTAQPDYCALCEEPATAETGPLVATRFGRMHSDCAESYEESEE